MITTNTHQPATLIMLTQIGPLSKKYFSEYKNLSPDYLSSIIHLSFPLYI